MPCLKICGVTNAAFALEAVRRKTDYIGFVFVEGSPRRVSAETARDIVSSVKGAKFVGVFSGQGVLKILAIAELVGLDIVQLHGGYSAEDVAALKSRGYEVWRLDSGDGFAGEDATLLDGRDGKRRGGTGRLADWSRVAELKREGRRVVLAGGISASNISAAVATGADVIDVNSSLETSPGEKSVERLEQLVKAFNASSGETTMSEEKQRLDDEIARLFKLRMDLAATEPINPAEERATLSRAADIVGQPLERDMKILFNTMFGMAKARRRAAIGGGSPLVETIRSAAAQARDFATKAVVACPGTEGSYAQIAASEMFEIPTILFFSGFESVFEAVEKGLCPYGILPIENSAAGSVAQVYDLMVKHRFHIVRSVRVKIDHVLLGRRGAKIEDIREVASHPHALTQCGAYLKAHPKMKPVPGANTAVAAKELAAGGAMDRAVIASRACAELYGLDILAEGIADAAYNYTRFICISRQMEITKDASKFSIMLSLPHRPGSLNGIIAKFAAVGVNLTKLESRPIPGMDFEFRFTFEFESTPTNPDVLALIAELSQDPEIEHFTFLGAYA